MRRSSLVAPLMIALALAGAAPAARAQAADQVLDVRSAEALRAQYMADLDTVHAKIIALAHAIPADKYGWRPGPGVRSVSEALMHVASEWYYFTPMSVAGHAPDGFVKPGEKVSARIAGLERITDKEAVLAELDRSWEQTRAQVSGADAAHLTGRYKPWGVSLPEAAFVMSGDLHEHLGQLIAYSRTLGVKPPWSK